MTGLPRFVVAAPASGHGKTTIAVGVMAALVRAGYRVSPGKVGPDYIDPGYHALATGRPGRNLDPWLTAPELVVPLLLHGASTPAPADIAVIEGVMGLFDGRMGANGFASTAQVAALTRSPVVLVVDISAAGRTAAAIVHGLRTFDTDVEVAGVVLNKSGSPRHTEEVRRAVEGLGVPVLGALPRDAGVNVPSRHLGLVPAAERDGSRAALERLAEQTEQFVDLAGLIEIARSAPDLLGTAWAPPVRGPLPTSDRRPGSRPVVAVAGGRSFTFRYTEADELLRAAGCDPVLFDPAVDTALPAGTRGLYLGGGFPEAHAAALAANGSLLADVHEAVSAGVPTIAECAGLLYLTQTLDGHRMVGAVPATAGMHPRLLLRYVSATLPQDGVLGPAGTTVHAHEFHRTRTEPAASAPGAWLVDGSPHGFALDPARTGRVTAHASYLHVHWAGHPEQAYAFADAVLEFAAGATVNGVATGTSSRPAATPVPARSTGSADDAAAAAPDGPNRPDRPRDVGEVVLVGGGPGPQGLITVAGLEAVRRADVVVVDRLAPWGLLDHAGPTTEVVHVGKIPRGDFTPQDRINELLVEHARAGRTVVRLKGGDGFVFGRGGEEWNACVAAGVPVSVVPGVTSAVAAPALAGIPATHRGLTQGVVVVAAHVAPDDPRCTIDWDAVARSGLTVVVLMGVDTLPAVADTLIRHGMDPDTPAATVAEAGMPAQRVVKAPLQALAEHVARAGLRPPAVTVVGPVVDALHPGTVLS